MIGIELFHRHNIWLMEVTTTVEKLVNEMYTEKVSSQSSIQSS